MMTLSTEICNAFNQNAHSYENAALVQNEIGERLFERLNFLKITPQYVLDLGSGTGLFSQALKKRYPKANIIGLDLAFAMLTETKKKQSWRFNWPLVNGNMSALPFADGVFDLVYANQVIHWSDSLSLVLSELYRVMHVGACFMFSTLGPDTFKELTHAFALADNYTHCNTFRDMHEIGDCLNILKFQDPVVDMEMITVHYGELSKLLLSLKAQGVRNVHSARNRGLTGKESWRAFEKAYQQFQTEEGKCPLTYEAVYGHAWKGELPVPSQHETRISISEIRRRK